jgi:chaperonin GroES
MNFKPLLDKVLVEPLKAEEKSAGGILLPGSENKKTNKGKVVAVGQGKRNKNGEVSPLLVSLGNTVLYNQYGGTEVKIEGSDYLVLSEENILGILE